MRVVSIVCNQSVTSQSGGGWTHLHSRNRAMLALGCDVRMLVGQAGHAQTGPAWRSFEYPVEIFNQEIPGWAACFQNVYTARRLAKTLATRALQLTPDLVLVSGEHCLGGLLAELDDRVPAIFDCPATSRERTDGPLFSPRRLGHLAHLLYSYRWFPRLSGAVVVTDYIGDECRRFAPALPTFTVPCACMAWPAPSEAAAMREVWRRRLGLAANEVVLAHSGGVLINADPRSMIALVQNLIQEGINARLLIATQDLTAMRGALSSAPRTILERTIIRNFPDGEHLNCLAAADAGILLRPDIPTHQAAFPNKVDEFWSMGVPVVTTPGLQAVARIVTENPQAGLVVANPPALLSNPALAWFRELCAAKTEDREERFLRLLPVRHRISYSTRLRPMLEHLKSLSNPRTAEDQRAALITT